METTTTNVYLRLFLMVFMLGLVFWSNMVVFQHKRVIKSLTLTKRHEHKIKHLRMKNSGKKNSCKKV